MALDSLVKRDSDLARKAIQLDDDVDNRHKDNFEAIRNDPISMDGLIYYLSISRYLERMGDLATNIAEDVVYHVDGEIIRHGGIQNPTQERGFHNQIREEKRDTLEWR